MVTLVGHARFDSLGSMGSVGSAAHQSTLPSPSPIGIDVGTAFTGQVMMPTLGRITSMSPLHADSSASSLLLRDTRIHRPLSTHSSTSDESSYFRIDQFDPLPRTAKLSLNTSATTPAPSFSTPATGRSSGIPSLLNRPAGFAPALQPQDSSLSSASDPPVLSRGDTSASPNNLNSPVQEGWRQYHAEATTSRSAYLSNANSLLSFGTLPVPSLTSSDRLPEIGQEYNHRILPLPRALPSQSHQHRLRSPSRRAPQSGSHGETPSPREAERNRTPLDRSESEAVNTLAGLAYGTPKSYFEKHYLS